MALKPFVDKRFRKCAFYFFKFIWNCVETVYLCNPFVKKAGWFLEVWGRKKVKKELR